MISSFPLTQIKRQAEYKQRSLKIRKQQQIQSQKNYNNKMASIIQRAWRNHAIQKQRIQQQTIKQLLLRINSLSLDISDTSKQNSCLQNAINDMQSDFEEIVQKQKDKQLCRITNVFKKTFNSILEHQIQHKYIEQQLSITKQNYIQSQHILQQLIQCSLILQKQQQQIISRDRQYQQNIQELEQTIMKQNLQINHLQFQYQELVSKKKKQEIESRFKQYLQ